MFLFALFSNSPRSEDDFSLIKSIVHGNSPALGLLYDRYGRLVFSLAYQVMGEVGAAEEVTQEVFLQVWHKAATYQPEAGKVISWLSSIARHKAIDMVRRRNVRPEGHIAGWDSEDEPDIVDPLNLESQADQAFQSAAVRRAVAGLPDDQRQALSLAFFDGLTHQEIARQTGEPLGTIKTRIRLAMIKLRQLLEDTNG